MRAYTRAAGADLPPARRARDGRHGGVHPEPKRPGGQRARAREGARGQGARGRRRLRRHLGRAPRPRAGRARGLRRACSGPARTRSIASATTSTSSAARAARLRASDGGDHRGGRAHQRRRRRCTTSRRGSRGIGACRDPQPDGGRRDRRDLARAAVAVDPPRRRRSTTAAPVDGRRSSASGSRRGARESELRDGSATPRELSRARSRSRTTFEEFLTLPAYELLTCDGNR